MLQATFAKAWRTREQRCVDNPAARVWTMLRAEARAWATERGRSRRRNPSAFYPRTTAPFVDPVELRDLAALLTEARQRHDDPVGATVIDGLLAEDGDAELVDRLRDRHGLDVTRAVVKNRRLRIRSELRDLALWRSLSTVTALANTGR